MRQSKVNGNIYNPRSTPLSMKKEETALARALILFTAFSVVLAPGVLAAKVPLFQDLDSEIFACSGEVLLYDFTATDEDGDLLDIEIIPKGPIYVEKILAEEASTQFRIFSKKLSRGEEHSATIYITDRVFIETMDVKIKAIEVNSPPVLSKIGVQTAEVSSGSFGKEIEATDEESSVSYSLDFLSGNSIFEVDQQGSINFVPKSTDIGVYDIKLCVTDSGLDGASEISTSCDQDTTSQTVCETFQFTVTDSNRRPTIISHYPLVLTMNASGRDSLVFNITTFDPDGTTPEISWYEDDELIPMSGTEVLEYSFGCGVSGEKNIRAEIYDGLGSDSVRWFVDIAEEDCTPSELTSEPECEQKFGCQNWNICQHAAQSLEVGILSDEDFEEISSACSQNEWSELNCGFQIRACTEVNECENVATDDFPRLQSCFFSLRPSCTDNLRNCHEGSCEILADCGGPCEACMTCTDSKQNHGETGVDCGGPCPEECRAESPFNVGKIAKYIIATLFVIAILVAVLMFLRVRKMRKKMRELTASINEKTEPIEQNKSPADYNISKARRLNLR